MPDQEHSGFSTKLGEDIFLKALTADNSYSGITAEFTAGENLAFGDVCYFKAADSKMWKADADASTTMPAIAMALEAITADSAGRFLLIGYVRDNAWAWTIGGYLWVHTTGGNPTQTQPSGSGDQVQALGIALSADIIYFNPDLTLVEVA